MAQSSHMVQLPQQQKTQNIFQLTRICYTPKRDVCPPKPYISRDIITVTRDTNTRMCPLQIKFHFQACLDKRQKYVAGADGAERSDSNRRDMDSDTAGVTASVRESRRGDLHLLVSRAHRLRLPGV